MPISSVAAAAPSARASKSTPCRNALTQALACGMKSCPSRVGHRPVAAALEQLDAENGLQFGDRLGDGRLRNGQALRRLLDPAELRDGQKTLEMTEFDAAVREASLHNERLYEKARKRHFS